MRKRWGLVARTDGEGEDDQRGESSVHEAGEEEAPVEEEVFESGCIEARVVDRVPVVAVLL